ncbi:MAG: hypothetical protein CM15mP127_15740 [Gammaproteobacteria bacterium]|nr:MAG: hypothetical protein CM15mP127_15740 [Gammaproteobacteria bacterium]
MCFKVGKVNDKSDDAENLALTTGSIEIIVDELKCFKCSRDTSIPLG